MHEVQNSSKIESTKNKSKTFRVVIGAQIFIQLIVPTPLVGGRNYILKQVFFVQSILADRYIHRREM